MSFVDRPTERIIVKISGDPERRKSPLIWADFCSERGAVI